MEWNYGMELERVCGMHEVYSMCKGRTVITEWHGFRAIAYGMSRNRPFRLLKYKKRTEQKISIVYSAILL